jgi:glycosyltransferase involved in cell wall biosynthesis
MTICIDCRMIGASGVGVYLKECLPYFLQSANSFLLLGNITQLNFYTLNANVNIIECNIKPFSIKELLFFPKHISKKINQAGLFYSPFFNIPRRIKIPVFTTIHDIVFPDMPELVSKTGLAVRMMFYRRAFKKSKKIFTASEFSKSRIEHHLGKTKPVIVTHSAIQPMFLAYRNKIQNVQKTQTIVFIGNIKKHKGLELLLDAFVLARNEGLTHKLVIIGSIDNLRSSDNSFFKKVEAIGDDAVIFTGFISDEKLVEYLSTAALLVQPSLYEGFCLPPLEAMVLGTSALISDIAVLREIYDGYPVTFFKAGDTKDLKEKMIELLMDKNLSYPILPDELLLKYTFDKTVSIIMRELQ